MDNISFARIWMDEGRQWYAGGELRKAREKRKKPEKEKKRKRKKKRVSIIHVCVQYVSHAHERKQIKCSYSYSGKPPYVPRQSSLEVMRSDSI